MNILSRFKKKRKMHIENDVIYFEDSPYLFLCQHNSSQHQFQYFKGEKQLPAERIDMFKQNIEFNSEYSSKAGIPYHHLVFPAKIPAFTRLFAEAQIDISPIFSQQHAHQKVSYPLPLLSDPADFMVQDTHNTDAGKLKVMAHMLEKLDVAYKPLTPVWKQVAILGDMGKRLQREAYPEHKLKGFEETSETIRTFSTASALSGNSGQIFYTLNPDAPTSKRLLLFGDSFIHSCLFILSHQFEEVIYLRSPFILPDIADNLQPDLISTSNAERYLVAVASAAVKKPYFLNYFGSLFTPSAFSEESKLALHALFSGRESPIFKKWKRKMSQKLVQRY